MSNIEWTQHTWNPLAGCDKVSAGCKECYAIRMAWRLMHSPHKAIAAKYAGTVHKTEGGSINWTGQINTLFSELDKPLLQKKPSLYFVNSMSDLFHDKVEISFIAEVFSVMWLTPGNTYQILTKRAERMLQVLTNELFFVHLWGAVQRRLGKEISYEEVFSKMPLKNVWLGVSVEDQKQADIRIPPLLQTPAAIRFLSCEPLLGNINLELDKLFYLKTDKLHWVIAGGESGPNARPSHPDWFRSLQKQCYEADVSFFLDGATVRRTGKKAAGSTLDGKEYKEYPKYFKIPA